MRFRLALLPLCLLLALSAGARAGRAGDAPLPIGDDLKKKKAEIVFRTRVSRAIDAGAHWIAEQQRADGSFKLEGNAGDGPHPSNQHTFGRSVLCLYTLADCGYAADHPVVKKALGFVKREWRGVMHGGYWPKASAYSLALLVLGLHTLYVVPGTEGRLGERDRYGARRKTEKNPCGYPKWVRSLIKQVLDWLMASQAEEGLFRYPGDLPGSGGPGREEIMGGPEDLSNSQYVLLALWAGSRCGYEIAIEKLERMARRLLAWQEQAGPPAARVEDPKEDDAPGAPSGTHRYAPPTRPPATPTEMQDRARGFTYTPNHPDRTGSMTSAGLSSLAIVKAMLMERSALKAPLRKELTQGIWDAIAWLTQNYDLDRNPGAGALWHYYYLYGLERACVIAGKTFLGEHDWYREGAEKLVDAQAKDGRWQPGNQLGGFGGWGMGAPYKTDVLDTCFALLFLKRATVHPRKPVLDDGPVTTPSAAK